MGRLACVAATALAVGCSATSTSGRDIARDLPIASVFHKALQGPISLPNHPDKLTIQQLLSEVGPYRHYNDLHFYVPVPHTDQESECKMADELRYVTINNITHAAIPMLSRVDGRGYGLIYAILLGSRSGADCLRFLKPMLDGQVSKRPMYYEVDGKHKRFYENEGYIPRSEEFHRYRNDNPTDIVNALEWCRALSRPQALQSVTEKAVDNWMHPGNKETVIEYLESILRRTPQR